MLGMALGCRFAVEEYLRSSKAHSEHASVLSIKYKAAVATPAGIFLTEGFASKHKSSAAFLHQLVTLQISRWLLLDADMRSRWEKDKRSKLVHVLDTIGDLHKLVYALSSVDQLSSSSTPFTRSLSARGWSRGANFNILTLVTCDVKKKNVWRSKTTSRKT